MPVSLEALELPLNPSSTGVDLLLRQTFGWAENGVLSPTEMKVYYRYKSHNGLRQLMRRLTPQQVTILILTYGLIDNVRWRRLELAAKAGCDPMTIFNNLKKAKVRMRQTEWDYQHRLVVEARGETFIEDLGLGPQAYRELLHAKIDSIELLVTMTEGALLRIHGIGPGIFGDIQTRLAERGLQLAT